MIHPNDTDELRDGKAANNVDAGRRNLALTLLGALGTGALLKGCTQDGSIEHEANVEEDDLAAASQALNGSTNIQWFDNVASMRAFSVGSNTNYTALVHGFATPGDGGGGIFVWSTAAAIDDGTPGTNTNSGTVVNPLSGAVINPSAAAGWRRVYSGGLNIRWFGARGDGVTDDTVSVQTAIDRGAQLNASLIAVGARAGTTVLVPPGVYLVSDRGLGTPYKLLLKDNVSIVGSGRSVSVFRSALNQNENSRLFSSPAGQVLKNVTIKGIAIDGRETSQPTPPSGNYQRAGIFINGSENLTITDCEIYNTSDCIRLHGEYNDRSTVTHNFCHSCPTDIGREVIQVNGARDSVIGWNYIFNCPFAGATKMEGATGWNNLFIGNVARNVGTGFAVGAVGAPYGTLESASQIKVTGNTFINCSVDSAIIIFGKNVLVSDNTIDGAMITGIAIMGESENVIVSNNHIKNVHRHGSEQPRGIFVEVRNNKNPTNLGICNNTIEVNATLEPNTVGVYVNQAAKSISVANNRIRGGALYGMVLYAYNGETYGVTITDNHFEVGSAGFGISMVGRATAPAGPLRDVIVTGNHVLPLPGATGTTGLQVGEAVDYLTVLGNNFRRCASASTGVLAVANRQVGNNFGTIA